MSETTELRVIDLGEYGFSLAKVDFIDGKSRDYSDDDCVLNARTVEALRQMVADLAAALDRPVLCDATDFPDRHCDDFSIMFTSDPGRKTARSVKGAKED